MNYIAQEDDFGCAVACIANKLQIDYPNALKLFQNTLNSQTIGYWGKDIKIALKKAGINSVCKWSKNNTVESGDIVFIKKSLEYPYGHYLLCNDIGFIDPWFNYPHKPRVANIRKVLPGKDLFVIKVLP
jgi:hypothetical protein